MLSSEHPFIHPLEAASALADEPHLTMLYSGLSEHHTGRYSLLAWGLEREITTSAWADIASALTNGKAWFENAWFGWLGYGMRHDCEHLSRGARSFIDTPDTQLMRYAHILRFDHTSQRVSYFHTSAADMRWQQPSALAAASPHITELTSPQSKQDYLDSVKHTRERILAGDFYQANITRKFIGHIDNIKNYLSLFITLTRISPAPYSAYIRHGDTHILSSSPECFLTIEATGHITTRPIKGSARRGTTPDEDNAIKTRLTESAKDHAENRMIVDLMRNDLSRVADVGSVKVTADAELTSYATVHHLISTITGQKSTNASTLDVVRACFPPGSMTGAPEIAAMEWCASQEQLERGVYSGAIGWFGGDGACDLSVVIRTLIIRDGRFEFQVGGGIVADSTPEAEWQETLVKARAIAALLGITTEALAAI